MINSLDKSIVYREFLTTELQDNIRITLFNDKDHLDAASWALQTHLPLYLALWQYGIAPVIL